MRKTHRLTIYSALILLIVSCSSADKTPGAAKKTYSSSTEREFRSIEISELKKTALAPIPQKEPITTEAPKKINRPVEAVPAPEQKLSAHNEERMQEINQNLAFYCMKHRKDPAFKTEEKCLSFTQRVLNSCEKKHQTINTVLVNCIKVGLKNRSL